MRPDRSISASLHAYRTLRERIVSLDLPPGSPAGEQGVADLLGMSRTPVREALARLAAEGLVDAHSRRGTVVAPIRVEAVLAAQFVRETLEVAIVREAAEGADEAQLFAASQAIVEQDFAARQGRAALFFEADERMHATFARMAGRELVWPIVADAKTHMDRLRRLSVQAIDLGRLVEDHRTILAAVEGRSPDGAEAAMRQHLRHVLRDLPQIVSRFGEFIEGAERVTELLGPRTGDGE